MKSTLSGGCIWKEFGCMCVPCACTPQPSHSDFRVRTREKTGDEHAEDCVNNGNGTGVVCT
jgi:hypothetical protein